MRSARQQWELGTAYRNLLFFALICLGVKASFLIRIWHNAPGAIAPWGLVDFAWIFLPDLYLYFSLRMSLDIYAHFFRRLSPVLRKWSLISIYSVLVFSTWYIVASSHYFAIMGEHLRLATVIRADLRKMTYLTAADIVLILLEALAVIVCCCYLLPKSARLHKSLNGLIQGPKITIVSISLLLLLAISLNACRTQDWFFNLDQNGFVTGVSSIVFLQKEKALEEYQFTEQPAFRRISPYTPVTHDGLGDLPHYLPGDRPNVILFVMESAGARHLMSYGGKFDSTPNFDDLRKKGLFFAHAYGHTSDSANAALPFFCGFYPHPSKGPESGTASDLSCDSLQSILKQRGYATAILSRWDFDFLNLSTIFLKNGVDALRFTRLPNASPEISLQSEEDLIAHALDWAGSRTSPFFLTIWAVPAHITGTRLDPASKKFGGETFERDYQSRLFYQDLILGKLIKGLRQKRLFDNSVIICMGDHGEGIGREANDFAHSNYLYEDIVRIPVLIVAPQLFDEQITVQPTFQQVDLLPTLVGLLGLTGTHSHQGRDFTKRAERSEQLIYLAYPRTRLLGIVDGQWKYIFNVEKNIDQFYDLASDPLEHTNIAKSNAEKTGYYRSAVKAWAMYQQDFIRNLAGTSQPPQARGEAVSLRSVPIQRTLPGNEPVEMSWPGENRQLYCYGKVYADGIVMPLGSTIKLDLRNLNADEIQFMVGAQSGACAQDAMPWMLSVQRDGTVAHTILLQSCFESYPVDIKLKGVSQLAISLQQDPVRADHKPAKTEGRIVLGEPRLFEAGGREKNR